MSLAIAPLAAHGSIVVALDLPALAARSDVVALGQVLSAVGQDDGRGGVVTRVTVRVERLVSGSLESTSDLTILVPGGDVPGRGGVHIPGAPHLSVGERYLLFLRRDQSDFWVVGLAQGAMPVYAATDGALMVEAAADLPMLVAPAGEGRLAPAVPALIAPTSLEQVLGELREVSR